MAEHVMTFPFIGIRPGELTWPVQGEWTYEDYVRLPEDGCRYEIIEGVLYMTNAPGFEHQYAVHQLAVALELWVRERAAGVVLTAPFEVHLPAIAKPVQPDVLFITAERRPEARARFFTGAPDLVIEVLSPTSMRLDRNIKFNAYERAGVREYWLVDPRIRFIEVYTLDEEGEFALIGQFSGEEQVTSPSLPGLRLVAGRVFA